MAGVGGVPEFDQRGMPFGRVFDGRIDIGAFEYAGVASDLNLVVDTLVDENDGNYRPGDLSLREAIGLANAYRGSRHDHVCRGAHQRRTGHDSAHAGRAANRRCTDDRRPRSEPAHDRRQRQRPDARR